MATRRQYAGHWERPDWIYGEIVKISKRIDDDIMIELKKRSMPAFQQKMAGEFTDFFNHYPKIFFRAINRQLSKDMLLMLLKEKAKIDNGEKSLNDATHEVTGAAFNLMLRGQPEEFRNKVINTYKDLVEEERKETREAIREKLVETGQLPPSDESTKDKIDEAEKVASIRPPIRIEEIE